MRCARVPQRVEWSVAYVSLFARDLPSLAEVVQSHAYMARVEAYLS
jgi:hypothetical protein